jgi:hypothetical protein
MPSLADFLDRLLADGSAVLRARPAASNQDRRKASLRLAAAFAEYRLDIAGPAVPFDAPAALAAAESVWLACWFLLQRREPAEEVEKALVLPPAPTAAAEHLSADLVLRFLPPLLRRARGLDAGDVLTAWLTRLLRQAPLSGVLSDIEEGPLALVELGGHPGLLLLYAERLADNVRPAWIPAEGPARPYVEMVFAERGLPLPAPAACGAGVPPAGGQPGRLHHNLTPETP